MSVLRLSVVASLILLAKAGLAEHTMERAGCPQKISWLAQPTNTCRFNGYYVGGGKPCKGDCRTEDEGTYGWDYFGKWIPKRVALNWSHGRAYQGGTGAYKTDGPHFVQPPVLRKL